MTMQFMRVIHQEINHSAKSHRVRGSTLQVNYLLRCSLFPFSGTQNVVREQRRWSFKYARHPQHTETQQPSYIHDKRYGLFSNERNVAKSRRGLPHITPLYKKHMNLWETDTDPNTNRFFRSYVFGQRELHQLLGRPHAFESREGGGRDGDSAYEAETDQRYKGVATAPMIHHLHYEPEWNYTLYAHEQHQPPNKVASGHLHAKSAAVFPRSPTREEILGDELARMETQNLLSLEHCKAWFDRLRYLIQLHYDAVGDIGDFRSRHTQHIHTFFVAFHDAISSFDFQDVYLLDQFQAARPKELEDIFGIFIEMEANYVHADYCPRCSLPYATTRYCGEGDADTPFRRHRGRWAPHPLWGKEWLDVVTRRAEALWYRATEDPYFGLPRHTQRQVEAMLRVYCQTKQRAKALNFIHELRGSVEFLTGKIHITCEMQQQLDALLDQTEHQHILTNSFKLYSRASIYTGEVQKVPFSPLQMLLDMKKNVFRRQQREEGVIRVPPASWSIRTDMLVPYEVDPQTTKITNWRQVKASLEKSFADPGLPEEAYTREEWRQLIHWKSVVRFRGAIRATLEKERLEDVGRASKTNKEYVVFPTRHWYQVFDTSKEAFAAFSNTDVGKTHSCNFLSSGSLITWEYKTFPNCTAVPYTPSTKEMKGATSSSHTYLFDVTPEACAMFGGFECGEVLGIGYPFAQVSKDHGSNNLTSSVEVAVVGVNKKGQQEEWALYAMVLGGADGKAKNLPPNVHSGDLIPLGRDCEEVYRTIGTYPDGTPVKAMDAQTNNENDDKSSSPANAVISLGRRNRLAPLPLLDRLRTAVEECLGQVVGVRNGMLYLQWRLMSGGGSEIDRSVATPVGTPSMVSSRYKIREFKGVEPLREPPSWWVPFRNTQADELLKEALQAPFQRERWASLIPGKYTPKHKHFGYTQHSNQDDFMTKEYRDRLLSRQFFYRPQMFAVLPERHETSVKFGGKWEHNRVCGLPTVDREELERGWGEANDISDREMEVMEQAIRDISGERPGNYIKSTSEISTLQLNESWWVERHHGWEEHNRQQRHFQPRVEQGLVDNGKLPFQGTIPPFGTSYGIGERIREIIRDYAKGFGLGSNGHTALHNQLGTQGTGGGMEDHALEREKRRIQVLGYGNALVRLFNEKLSVTNGGDAYSWAVEQSSALHYTNVKSLLISLQDWREKGGKLSSLLQSVLAVYLKEEVQQFNLGLPSGVPKLLVEPLSTVCRLKNDGDLRESEENVGQVGGSIWEEVDRREYGYEYVMSRHEQTGAGDAGTGFILDLVLKAIPGDAGGDERSRSALVDKVTLDFQLAVAKMANVGIAPGLLLRNTSGGGRGSARGGGRDLEVAAVPYILASAVADILQRFRITRENISMILNGLRMCSESEEVKDQKRSAVGQSNDERRTSTQNGSVRQDTQHIHSNSNDMILPVSLLFTWGGPQAITKPLTSTAEKKKTMKGNNSSSLLLQSNSRKSWTDDSESSSMKDKSKNGKTVADVLEELRRSDDGAFMDLNYTIERNFRNQVLRQEFMETFQRIQKNSKLLAKLYADYAMGRWVPNINDAIQGFVAFLEAYATRGDAVRSAAAVDYFEFFPPKHASEEQNAMAPLLSQTHSPTPSIKSNSRDRIHVIGTTAAPGGYRVPPLIQLLPPGIGSFQYENTLLESMETFRRFQSHGILAGPTTVPTLPFFMSSTTKETMYTTMNVDNTRYHNKVSSVNKGGQDRAASSTVVQVRVGSDYGLQKAVLKSPHFTSLEACPLVKHLVQKGSTTSSLLLVNNFNRFYMRVLPMLHIYASLLKNYEDSQVSKIVSSATARQELTHILEDERSPSIEQAFRRSSEMYWRGVLDGRRGGEDYGRRGETTPTWRRSTTRVAATTTPTTVQSVSSSSSREEALRKGESNTKTNAPSRVSNVRATSRGSGIPFPNENVVVPRTPSSSSSKSASIGDLLKQIKSSANKK